MEAAERLGLSVSGMKSRVQRARLHLRTALDECCRIALDRRGGVISYEARTEQCGTCQGPSETPGSESSPRLNASAPARTKGRLQETSSAHHLEEVDGGLGSAIVNRRLTMTTKTIPDAPACESEPAVCCPPEGQAVELLTAPVEGPAADEELAAFAKAIAHPTRVRILRMLAKKEARMCSHIVDELPLAQSTVSEHLRILRSAGSGPGERERSARQLLHRPVRVETAEGITRGRCEVYGFATTLGRTETHDTETKGHSMTAVRVFDPAMCCSRVSVGRRWTPSSRASRRISTWLKAQGVSVERFNLCPEPAAFVASDAGLDSTLETKGAAGLARREGERRDQKQWSVSVTLRTVVVGGVGEPAGPALATKPARASTPILIEDDVRCCCTPATSQPSDERTTAKSGSCC